MSFRIIGLPAEKFDHLFGLSDADLAAHGAVRRKADGEYPCRISLTDSKPGDELILTNYEHHAVDSPYRMRFAIMCAGARRAMTRSTKFPSSCASARSRRARSTRTA